MKTKPNHKNLKAIIALGLSTGVLYAPSVLAIDKPYRYFLNYYAPGEEEPSKKKKAKSKTFVSLNNNVVKIYHDAFNKDVHVVAKNNSGKEIDFFVFDLEGTLMENYRMKAKDHYRISGLAKGMYIYRVFVGDEETVSGKIEIR